MRYPSQVKQKGSPKTSQLPTPFDRIVSRSSLPISALSQTAAAVLLVPHSLCISFLFAHIYAKNLCACSQEMHTVHGAKDSPAAKDGEWPRTECEIMHNFSMSFHPPS